MPDFRGFDRAGCARSFDGLLLAGMMVLAILMLGPVLTIPLHIPLNYNEGWNAIFAQRAVIPGAGPLYPRASFMFNNYPPLGFYIVGALGRFVFGDMIVAGRVVGLLGLLASAGLVGICVARLGACARAASAAALLMLLYAASYYRQYVAIDDPQWLAHACMLAGLAVFLRADGVERHPRGEVRPTTLAAAALLMLAGGFIKHNLVALPLTITVWLLIVNRRAALVWLAAAAILAAAGLAAVALLHGSVAFDDILHHRRILRIHLLTHAIARLLPIVPMALVAAFLFGRTLRPGCGRLPPPILFTALFVAIAEVTGIAQRVGEGVYYNAHFETLIAVCISFGLALGPAFVQPPRWRGVGLGPARLCCIAALPVVGALPWQLPIAWHSVHDRAALVASWRPVIERIAAAPGPAGCEMMSLCWWAGKPSQVDLFNLTQSVLAGGPLAPFRATVAAHGFAIFEDRPSSFLHGDALRRLGHDPVMDAFAGNYAEVARGPDDTRLLAPIGP